MRESERDRQRDREKKSTHTLLDIGNTSGPSHCLNCEIDHLWLGLGLGLGLGFGFRVRFKFRPGTLGLGFRV